MKRSPLKRTGFSGKRQPLPRVNHKRSKKRKAITYGPQSQICRESPCCVPECGWVPFAGQMTHPHHWPTVAAGGTDMDVSPLCPGHHLAFHSQCGNRFVFLDRFGVDVSEVARLMAEKIKEES